MTLSDTVRSHHLKPAVVFLMFGAAFVLVNILKYRDQQYRTAQHEPHIHGVTSGSSMGYLNRESKYGKIELDSVTNDFREYFYKSEGNSDDRNVKTPNQDDSYLQLIAEMRETSEEVQRRCKQYTKYDFASRSTHILYTAYRTKRQKFMFAPIPKNGWTSWNWILFEDAGRLDVLHKYHGSWAWYTPYKQGGMKIIGRTDRITVIGKQATDSLIFIRHPYKRLISAYRNKVLEKRLAWCPNGPVRHYRKGIDPPISFSDYVDCILTAGKQPPSKPLYSADAANHIEMHYRPQLYLGNHCKAKFSLVARFEKYSEYLPAIMRYLNIRSSAKRRNVSGSFTRISDIDYMHMLSSTRLNQLEMLYSADFDTFGYDRSLESLR